MKALLLILSVFLPVTVAFSQEQPAANVAAGSVKQADQYTWDFGAIKQKKIVKHDFDIKNNSDKALNIKNISTSCGCTASAAKKKVLAPGEITQVSVEFDSKGYKGVTSQFVYVSTDDPANPVLKLTIKADVE